MADNLLETLLGKLGVQMPAQQPAPTPEQRQLYEEMAKREQAKSGPVAKAVRGGLEGGADLLKGLTISDPNMPLEELQKASPWQKGGMLLGTAPIFPGKGIKGLCSRAERIAESLPEMISGGKLASILKGNAAKEEIGWRGLDKVIADPSKTVAKQDVVSTLQKNPLDVKVTEKRDVSYKPGMDAEDYEEANHFLGGTQYNSYVMPGAKNYRETLIQLPVSDELAKGSHDPTRGPNPVFTSHHWPDDPNTLVHVRHNERHLPGPLPKDYRVMVGSNDRFDPAAWVTGKVDGQHYDGPDVSYPTGDIHDITDEHKQRAIKLAMLDKLGAKGRMLENIQSDWHQRGAHGGYAGSVGSVQDRNDAAYEAMTSARATLKGRIERIYNDMGYEYPNFDGEDIDTLAANLSADLLDRSEAPQNFETEDLNNFLRWHRDLQQDRVRVDTAEDAMVRSSGDSVPDAPFKDSWAELALKQQLLDVADRPDLDWIGIAPQSELAARGEDISHQFQDVQLPRTLEKLLKPFGGKVEKADLGIKPSHLSDPISILPESTYLRGGAMQRAADELGPKGGFIQPERMSGIGDMTPIMSFLKSPDNVDMINDLKNQIINQRPNIQAFIARLSPEMKQQIKEKGFPLLLALLAQQQMEGNMNARNSP